MQNLLLALLDGAPATGQGEQPSMMPTIIMMVVLVAVFYFFMIRPQSKKQKEIQKFRNALQRGQEVVTIGGLHGTITNIDEAGTTITLEVATGVKMVFEKSAIMPAGTAPQK